MTSTTTLTTADFIDAMGVDTHIPYTDGGYADIGKVIADLSYLGISNVRDGITDGQFGSAPMSSYVAMARAGIRFTIVADNGLAPTTAGVAYEIGLLDRLVAAIPGSVVAAEGANEINNWPVTFDGQTGLDGALALQRDIYSSVHSDPTLAGVAVDYLTGYAAGAVPAGPDPSTTPGLADFDNQHPYPKWGQAPAAWLATGQALGNEPTPGPFVYTETGYTTNGTDISGVSQDVQAKYLLDLYFDAAKDGASKTFVYQLMDAYAPGSPQGDDGYGLFNPDGTPKPAATAIHDLTAILSAAGTAAKPITIAPPDYAVSGLPSTGNSMAIADPDGTFDIAVWNEPQIWNGATRSETAPSGTPVTVHLGGTYASVSVYDPMVGTAPVETLSGVGQVRLSVTDHPLIIELGAPSAAAANAQAATPGTAVPGPAPAVSPAATVALPATTSLPAVPMAISTTTATAAAAMSMPGAAALPTDTTGTPVPATPAPAAATTVHADGSSTVDVAGSGQTLISNYRDTFLDHGLPDNTFVFDPGFERDIIRQFRIGGEDHDSLSLPAADFSDVADVLRGTRTVSGGAVITDPVSGDMVRLVGVTKAQLAQNRADIAFHG